MDFTSTNNNYFIGDISIFILNIVSLILLLLCVVFTVCYLLSWLFSFFFKSDSKFNKIITLFKRKRVLVIVFVMFILFFGLQILRSYIFSLKEEPLYIVGKPVIYLYPTTKQNVAIHLQFDGTIDFTYPQFDKTYEGWNVEAYPDGSIIDNTDGNQYSYLFWEGTTLKGNYDLEKGWVIEGSQTVEFLRDKLSQLGLTPKEYNDFIVYWAPLMQDNKYNLIHFAQEEYTDIAKLEIDPSPDSLLRVFMVYKPLNSYVKIEPQDLHGFERNGFTVVEWGGTKIHDFELH